VLSLISNLHLLAATEESSGLGALGVDPVAILAQASTFLILFLILKKFAFNGISDQLEKRRAKIENSIKEAEALSLANQKSEDEIKKALAKASKESGKILEDAKQESARIIESSRAEAKSQSEKIVKSAEAKIKMQTEKAKSELKSELANLVASATEKVIGVKMDSAQDKKIIDEALKN
jgi:F-type H+-transporting ATPase subunit b